MSKSTEHDDIWSTEAIESIVDLSALTSRPPPVAVITGVTTTGHLLGTAVSTSPPTIPQQATDTYAETKLYKYGGILYYVHNDICTYYSSGITWIASACSVDEIRSDGEYVGTVADVLGKLSDKIEREW